MSSGGGLARQKGGATPNAGGRFQAPSAPVSGLRGRRGVTPKSSSRTKPIGGLSLEPSKPKLTPRQHLEILRRLETGKYNKDMGIEQFYEEFNVNTNGEGHNDSSKLTCKQNLFASFASAEPQGNNMAGKSGSLESLVSVGSSVVSSVPSTLSRRTGETDGGTVNDVTALEVNANGLCNGQDEELQVGYGREVPHYLKLFDELINAVTSYGKNLEYVVNLQCKTTFAQLLPPEKMITFFQSLKHVQEIIHKFLQRNASENMDLFMPTRQIKGAPPPQIVHCNVEKHQEVVDAVYELSRILDKIGLLVEDENLDLNLGTKLETLKETVNNLEDLIKCQEKYAMRVNELTNRAAILGLTNVCDPTHVEVRHGQLP